MPERDDAAPAPKSTEISDLAGYDDAAVKGGALSADRSADPCWKPGTMQPCIRPGEIVPCIRTR